MPVYNAEKLLRRSIGSVLAQTLQDFELICIDDGSQDNSAAIINDYIACDSRIHVIHKQNEGVSAARQDGLNASKGEFIIHVDSDDWIEPDMLRGLYDRAIDTAADMVICDYFINSSNSQIYRQQKPTRINDNEQTIRDLFSYLHGSCWNKLVRRECFNRYSISFPKGLNYCEDQLTIVRLLAHPIKVVYLNKAYYHYYDNPSSITRNYKRKQYEDRLLFLGLLEKELSNNLRKEILPKLNLTIFTEAFVFNVLTKQELSKGIRQLKRDAFKSSGIRWRIGYSLIYIGLYKPAHYFIHF